jgi:hypothetical protein
MVGFRSFALKDLRPSFTPGKSEAVTVFNRRRLFAGVQTMIGEGAGPRGRVSLLQRVLSVLSSVESGSVLI